MINYALKYKTNNISHTPSATKAIELNAITSNRKQQK